MEKLDATSASHAGAATQTPLLLRGNMLTFKAAYRSSDDHDGETPLRLSLRTEQPSSSASALLLWYMAVCDGATHSPVSCDRRDMSAEDILQRSAVRSCWLAHAPTVP